MTSISEYAAILSLQAYDSPLAVGNALVIAASELLEEFKDSNFSATAYSIDGQIVIAYRGTNEFWPDAITGYPTAIGAYSVQARLALKFYNYVADLANQKGMEIAALTGHSLGGGLAGYVAALKHKQAYLFDHMPFEKAAADAYTIINEVLDPESSAYADYPPAVITEMKQLIYGDAEPRAPSTSALSAYSVEGEFLHPARSGQTVVENVLGLGPDVPLGPWADGLHSMSLLAIRLATPNGEEGQTPDWLSAGRFVFPALFDNAVASALGIKAEGNDTSAAMTMRKKIAYSTLSEGALPNGTAAARVFFNDANDFGKAVQAGFTFAADFSNAKQDVLTQVGRSVAGYAGQLARDASKDRENQGILDFNDAKILKIDYSTRTWGDGSKFEKIPGASDLFDKTVTFAKHGLQQFDPQQAASEQPIDVKKAITSFYGDEGLNRIDSVQLAVGDTFNGTIERANSAPSEGIIVFVRRPKTVAAANTQINIAA